MTKRTNKKETLRKKLVKERDENKKILKENRRLKAELAYETYTADEEREWGNDLLGLLKECKPIIKEGNEGLHQKIERVILAASV